MRIYDETLPKPTLRKTVIFPRRDERPAAAPAAVKEKPGAISAKAINIKVMLDPVRFLAARIVDRLTIQTGDLSLSAALNPKSVHKARASIEEHGVAAVAVMLQGQLGPRNTVQSAGLSVSIKTQKA